MLKYNAASELISTHYIVCSDVKVKCCANIFCLQVPTYHLVSEGFLLLWILWSFAKVITEYEIGFEEMDTPNLVDFMKKKYCMFKVIFKRCKL